MLRAGEIAQASASKSKIINLLQVPGGTDSQQVMLQVRFAEVNRRALTELGVSLFAQPRADFAAAPRRSSSPRRTSTTTSRRRCVVQRLPEPVLLQQEGGHRRRHQGAAVSAAASRAWPSRT